MSRKKRKLQWANWQNVHEVELDKNFDGEKSAYWDWAFKHSHVDENGEVQESLQANPDFLPEQTPIKEGTLNRAIMRKIIGHVKFSRQERAVLDCLGIQGLTEEKTAETLSISRRNVRICLMRAQKKCEKILAAKLRNLNDISEEIQQE